MRLRSTATAMALALMAMQAPAWADIEAANRGLRALAAQEYFVRAPK